MARQKAQPAPAPTAESGWTFLTNHAHVLLLLEREGDLVMRDIAQRVGITERAVQRIVADLVDGGFLRVSKDGRRNTYAVDGAQHLRHPIESHRTVGELLRLVR
jgi:DNA-binding MarR family transcriptional regulator